MIHQTGIASAIGWVDFSSEHREKVKSVIDLLSTPGVIDELGIGVIVNMMSSGQDVILICDPNKYPRPVLSDDAILMLVRLDILFQVKEGDCPPINPRHDLVEDGRKKRIIFRVLRWMSNDLCPSIQKLYSLLARFQHRFKRLWIRASHHTFLDLGKQQQFISFSVDRSRKISEQFLADQDSWPSAILVFVCRIASPPRSCVCATGTVQCVL